MNSSTLRCSLGSIQSSAVNLPSDWDPRGMKQATWQPRSETSNSSMRRAPLPPAISRDQFASSPVALQRAQHQTTRYPRRTPQNSGNAAFTISLISDRNAVGWNNCPSGMHGNVSSART